MPRLYIRKGDLFAAKLDEHRKKYFQYVADDMTMLNSRVIRVFRESYPPDATPDLESIVRGEVDFYAHVVIRWGVQMGLWEKVGNVKEVGTEEIFFRDSNDYGNPEIKVSKDWQVWKINGPFHRYIGKLPRKFRSLDIGPVVAPIDIMNRMRTGRYHYLYPGY